MGADPQDQELDVVDNDDLRLSTTRSVERIPRDAFRDPPEINQVWPPVVPFRRRRRRGFGLVKAECDCRQWAPRSSTGVARQSQLVALYSATKTSQTQTRCDVNRSIYIYQLQSDPSAVLPSEKCHHSSPRLLLPSPHHQLSSYQHHHDRDRQVSPSPRLTLTSLALTLAPCALVVVCLL